MTSPAGVGLLSCEQSWTELSQDTKAQLSFDILKINKNKNNFIRKLNSL